MSSMLKTSTKLKLSGLGIFSNASALAARVYIEGPRRGSRACERVSIRAGWIAVLFAKNVLAGRYFFSGYPSVELRRSYFSRAEVQLQTKKLCPTVIVLPNGTTIDESAVTSVCAVVGAVTSDASNSRPARPAVTIHDGTT
jgi:hypothetical protein